MKSVVPEMLMRGGRPARRPWWLASAALCLGAAMLAELAVETVPPTPLPVATVPVADTVTAATAASETTHAPPGVWVPQRDDALRWARLSAVDLGEVFASLDAVHAPQAATADGAATPGASTSAATAPGRGDAGAADGGAVSTAGRTQGGGASGAPRMRVVLLDIDADERRARIELEGGEAADALRYLQALNDGRPGDERWTLAQAQAGMAGAPATAVLVGPLRSRP